MDPMLLDEHFPHRPTGYFDGAAVGVVPAAVSRAVAAVGKALEGGLTGSQEWRSYTGQAFELLAEDLGVPADRLVAVANTSEALNLAARAIPFRPGDQVLTYADDFPSPRLPWTTVPAVSTREIAPGHGDERTDALINAIDDGVRVVSITHVHATTGTAVDLERVASACRSVGALLVVDGAQAAGITPAAALHADVYVAPSYKWLLAGFGVAVVATSEAFDELSAPTLVGYRNRAPSPRLHVGHDNLFGLAALQAAAEVRQSIGLTLIHDHVRRLVARVAAEVASMGIATESAHADAGIVTLALDDATEAQMLLSAQGSVTAVRDGCLRVSPSMVTTDADVDRLLESLDRLAR